jgi:hypothetical protein
LQNFKDFAFLQILYASTEDPVAVSDDARVLEGEEALMFIAGEEVAVDPA